MSSKFSVLGKYVKQDDKMIDLLVRKNYRCSDGYFEYENISVKIGICISKTMLKSLIEDDVILIDGRIESENNQTLLISEHLTRVKEYK